VTRGYLGGGRSVGKPRARLGECCLEGRSRVAPDTELEGGSREDARLEEGDRGGHGPITGRNTTRG